ncbi:MAG: hypothetical protein VKJ02_13390 [Snowella sp.]|nr:hypothetical protein [Snowella sp.]
MKLNLNAFKKTVSENTWSISEKSIAEQAFKKAYDRETQGLVQYINQHAPEIQDIDSVWKLNDYLNAKRHQIDGKYDYRYSALIFVFSDLMKEGWLLPEDLEGLDQDKISKIKALSRM